MSILWSWILLFFFSMKTRWGGEKGVIFSTFTLYVYIYFCGCRTNWCLWIQHRSSDPSLLLRFTHDSLAILENLWSRKRDRITPNMQGTLDCGTAVRTHRYRLHTVNMDKWGLIHTVHKTEPIRECYPDFGCGHLCFTVWMREGSPLL